MKLKIKLRVSPITQLAQDSDGMYSFVVDFNNVNGTPLNNENVPNSVEVTAMADGSLILLPIEIKDGNYSVPVWINIFNKDKSQLLVDIDGYSLVVRENSGEPGSYRYELIKKGLDDHLNAVLTPDGEYVILDDMAPDDVNPPYEYRYMIGSKLIMQGHPLKNYKFAANNGFWAAKFKTKIGLDTLNRWEDVGAENTYYDKNAGQTFSHNSTAGIQTGFFIRKKVEGGFEQHVPDNFDPSLQQAQWADIMPDLKLKNGHMFFLNRGDWSMDQVMRKGVTHISHYAIPRPNGDESLALELKEKGVTYNDVPTMTQIFSLPDTGVDNWVDGYNTRYWVNGPLTDEQAIAQAKRHQWLDALWIGETMENNPYMPPDKRMWLPFYEQLKKQYIEKFGSRNIPWYICHNYFMQWRTEYNLGQQGRQSYKDLLRMSPEQMPRTNFSPGAPLSGTTLIMEAVYPGPPDIQQPGILDAIYKMKVIRKLGYEAGIFLSSVFEYKPNNYFENKYDDGKYYEKGKIPLDPNVIIAYAFYSQRWGKVFVEWGGIGKVNAGRIFNSKTFEPTIWYRNGSNEPKISRENPDQNDIFKYISNPEFPHQKNNGVGYYGYSGGVDLCRFGLQLYVDTWDRFEGGKEQFLKYRIDGGQWINAVNQELDDVVDARYDQRGLVDSISLNGEICWNYQNCFADNLWHDIEVELPNGRISKERVSGNGIHVKVESL